MRKILLFLMLALSTYMATSQVNVTLHMEQKLGVEQFDYNLITWSPMGYPFVMTRMEYYVAGIQLVHDGGQITPMTDLFLLVDPATDREFELGSYPITELEKIEFSIGVDSSHNHLDPTTYPNDHPLAIQNPSMHWGWAAGYRFVALEGWAGDDTSSLNNSYQIHALGDANYHQISIEVDGHVEGDQMSIYLEADYAKYLSGIDVSDGLLAHSTTGNARKTIENSKFVFSAGEPTSIIEPGVKGTFQISPNPTNGISIINYDFADFDPTSIVVSNLLGQIVLVEQMEDFKNTFELKTEFATGIYLVTIFSGKRLLAIEKLIVE